MQYIMNRRIIFAGCLCFFAVAGLLSFSLVKNGHNEQYAGEAINAGLTLPKGFSAAALADHIGSARHLAVTPGGDIYVHLAGLKDGKGILVLHDNGTKAEWKIGFGDFGGTGIRIKNNYLYASSNHAVYRYKLNNKDEVADPGHPELIVGNLTTGSFVDYTLPSAADLPSFLTDQTITAATSNPLGVKGVGEAGCIASTPAVMNAVVDAVRQYGINDIRMPATPERVWRAINGDGHTETAAEQTTAHTDGAAE